MYINCSVSLCSPSPFYPLVHNRGRVCLFAPDHAQTHTTVGTTPLDEGSARRRDLYLTTQTLYKKQTSMPPVGVEPTIPASARPQTYALARAVTGIGYKWLLGRYSSQSKHYVEGIKFCLNTFVIRGTTPWYSIGNEKTAFKTLMRK
jgi:hypothetical protein